MGKNGAKMSLIAIFCFSLATSCGEAQDSSSEVSCDKLVYQRKVSLSMYRGAVICADLEASIRGLQAYVDRYSNVSEFSCSVPMEDSTEKVYTRDTTLAEGHRWLGELQFSKLKNCPDYSLP